MSALQTLERVEQLLADPDELRRHLQASSLEREPREMPELDVESADRFLSEPSLLLAHYHRLGARSESFRTRQLGRMGQRHRSRLDLTPPTSDDLTAKQIQRPTDSPREMPLTARSSGEFEKTPFLWEWWRWESAAEPERWAIRIGSDGVWILDCPPSHVNAELVIQLVHPQSGRQKSTSCRATAQASLPELGPAKQWLDAAEDELRIRVSSSTDDASYHEERIPLQFGSAYLHLWNREEDFGFWSLFQALYRRFAQPTRVFDWITTELARIRPTLRVGRAPLTGIRALSEKIYGDLLDARSAAGQWRKAHPTPLELLVADRSWAPAGSEWTPVRDALRQAFAVMTPNERAILKRGVEDPDRCDSTFLKPWHHLLSRFVSAGQPLPRAVELLLPIVPFEAK